MTEARSSRQFWSPTWSVTADLLGGGRAHARAGAGSPSDLIDPSIALHHGRIVKRTGDGIIIEFRSVVDAARCAIEVQTGMVERNAGLPPERRIEFRVGIHLGDVVEETDGDLMGDGVNIAARLKGIAEPGASGVAIPQLNRKHPPSTPPDSEGRFGRRAGSPRAATMAPRRLPRSPTSR